MPCGAAKSGSARAAWWAKFAFMQFGGAKCPYMPCARATPPPPPPPGNHIVGKSPGQALLRGKDDLHALSWNEELLPFRLVGQATPHPLPPGHAV